jgi:LysR family positive regulator for ilvC
MDLADYRALLTLAETLHFTRAAAALHMSASALSRAVQRWEQELGQELFVRDRRHVRLTRAGELVAAHAHAQLRADELLREQLAEEAVAPSGEIRIACTVTACHSVLPNVLAKSRARFPELTLKLMTSDAVAAAARLSACEADLAVLPLADTLAATLAVQPLAKTALCFIARKEDAAYARLGRRGGPSLSEVPWILPQQGLERERFDAFMAAEAATADIYAEVSGNEAIIAMVSLGCGVGLVPELVLSDSPLREQLLRLPVPRGPKGYVVGACVRRADLRRRALAAFWSLFTSG